VPATGEPVGELWTRAPLPANPEIERDWVSSCYPVRVGGEVVGLGVTVREVTGERVSDAEREQLLKEALMSRAEAQAAQVRAESASREAEVARARTAFIAEAGARMATSLDPGRAMQELADLAVPAVADWCSISMVAPDGRLTPVAASHADPERRQLVWEMAQLRPLHVEDELGPPMVLRAGQPLLTTTVSDAVLQAVARDEVHLAQMRALGVASSLIVPLKTPGRPIGTITLVYAESGRRYEEEDVAMARALAARAALHVENARLYTERSNIARTLQAGLLPGELPAVPGAELAVGYRAAGDENEVGGDFYDVFAAGEDRWIAVVGDVAGKGAQAATVTALSRHTLYAGALREADAVANLRLLNDALLRRGGEGHLCTVVVAELVPQDGGLVVRLANGGHPPPLILRTDGSVEETTAIGTMVGATGEPRFEDQELVLAPGELLLLYTDGVIELRTEDPTTGERRLRATLAAQAGRPAAEVVEAVERSVVEGSGGTPRDDIALLAVRALSGYGG
jgi:serine phosphatase RsbU (regulator of sigma subunit)